MLTNLNQLSIIAKHKTIKRLVVVFPHDHEVMDAVLEAHREGIVKPILIGDEKLIKSLSKNVEEMVVIHEPDPNLASKKAMDFVNNQDADIIMKGLIDTKILLKAVVNTTYGIKQQKLLSHVGLLSFADLNHVIFVTDGAMNIAPTVDEKIAIIENAVLLAQNIGYEKPKVGLVSAVEKVNLKMQSTVDASDILTYYQNKEITFQIDGPFAIDNLVSHEAAKHKGITSEIAGEADILVFPNIESGNVFYKTSVFLAHAKSAGIICGAKVPIVLTSRADSMETKLHSIFLAVVM